MINIDQSGAEIGLVIALVTGTYVLRKLKDDKTDGAVLLGRLLKGCLIASAVLYVGARLMGMNP